VQIPTDVHLIVAADSPGSIAGLLLEKQQELDAAALVVASHGKQALQVRCWAGLAVDSRGSCTAEDKQAATACMHLEAAQVAGTRSDLAACVFSLLAGGGLTRQADPAVYSCCGVSAEF
jgi:hypothetical protein